MKKKFKKKKDFLDLDEKRIMKSNPKEVLRILEEDLINKVKLAKEDIENVVFWRTPDTPQEYNKMLKSYPSIVIYWGTMYNSQFRIAKKADIDYNNYLNSKRSKCYAHYVKEKADKNGRLNKQPTADDYQQIFQSLFGKKKEYLRVKNIDFTLRLGCLI